MVAQAARKSQAAIDCHRLDRSTGCEVQDWVDTGRSPANVKPRGLAALKSAVDERTVGSGGGAVRVECG
jgi:hypothetical protein